MYNDFHSESFFGYNAMCLHLLATSFSHRINGTSHNPFKIYPQHLGNLLQRSCVVANTQGVVMRRPGCHPPSEELSDIRTKGSMRIGIARRWDRGID